MNQNLRDHFKTWLSLNKAENDSVRTKTSNDSSSQKHENLKVQTDIAFKNDGFKLVVEKAFHKRQKNFKIQDHLFYLKIQQIDASTKMPLLTEILDFLHAAIVHVLDSIKLFYNKGKIALCFP